MAAESMILQAILQFDSGAAIQNIGRASASFSRLKQGAAQVGEGLKKTAGSLGMFTVGMLPAQLAMGSALNSAREFGKAIGMIQTITDEASMPVKNLEMLNKGLAISYGTTSTEQAQAMYDAISSGADTAEKAVTRMDSSNRLAVAGGAELGTTLKLMGTIMNTYGKQGLTTAEASDYLFQSTNYGIQTIAELGASMGDVIGNASKLKVPFGELNAAIAATTLQGISANEATTGLNMALVNVLKPTKDASDLAKELKINFSAEGIRKAGGLGAFFDEVMKKTGGSEEALTRLFGSVMGFRVATALTTNQGEVFNDMLQKMSGESVAGSTDRAFEKMSRTLDFQIKKTKALGDVGMTTFGQILQRPLGELMIPLNGVLTTINNILEAVKSDDFTKVSGTTADIARGIKEGLKDVEKGISAIKAAFKDLGSSIEDSFGGQIMENISRFLTAFIIGAAIITPVIGVIGALGFVGSTVLGVLSGVGATLAGVFGALTGPLGIALALLYIFRDEVFAMFEGAYEVAGPFITDVIDYLQWAFNDMINTFRSIGAEWAAVTGGMQADWKEVGRVIASMLGGIFMGILVTIGNIIVGIVRLVGFVIRGIGMLGTVLGEVAGKIVVFLMNPLAAVAKLAVSIMEAGGMKPPAGIKAYAVAHTPAAETAGATVARIQAIPIEEKRKEKEQKAAEKTDYEKFLDESRRTADAAMQAAKGAEDAAKKKTDTKVNIDGREVARASAKHEREIQIRTGASATPWQKRQIVVNGARSL